MKHSRSSLLTTALLSLILAFVTHSVAAQCSSDDSRETVRGTVFLDSNENNVQDQDEAGIAAVAVSNGCEVVQTDSDGHYSLSLAATDILFISKPADFAVPVDENNLPQFFYRHYPEGTPSRIAGTDVEWLFPVVTPTGPLPESVDFALIPLPDASPGFRAYGFADTQARYDTGQDMLREDLVTPLIGNPADAQFGLTVGDVVYDNLALYDRHKAMMALMAVPQWYLPGNHDVNFESPDAAFANETYKSHFGPTYYSFNHGEAHIVALNNVEYAGAGKEFADGRYRGFISERQLDWLEQDLAQVPTDKLIVIATHIPLITEADDGRNAIATGPRTENFQRLLGILTPFPHIYGLAGHDTSNSWKVEINHRHGWTGQPWIAHTLAEVRGSGWTQGPADLRGVRDAMMDDGNPNGYYVMHFDGVKLTPEFIPFPFGSDASQRLRITLDPPLVNDREISLNRGVLEAGTMLVVNLFDGGIRDKVWVSLDGSEAIAMQYTVRTDPFVERAHARFANTDDEYGSATRSSHIWQWSVPAGLAPGIHVVSVTSEDEFVQRQHGAMSFEILSE